MRCAVCAWGRGAGLMLSDLMALHAKRMQVVKPESWQQEFDELFGPMLRVLARETGTETAHFKILAITAPDSTTHMWRFDILAPDRSQTTFIAPSKDAAFSMLRGLEYAYCLGAGIDFDLSVSRYFQEAERAG